MGDIIFLWLYETMPKEMAQVKLWGLLPLQGVWINVLLPRELPWAMERAFSPYVQWAMEPIGPSARMCNGPWDGTGEAMGTFALTGRLD